MELAGTVACFVIATSPSPQTLVRLLREGGGAAGRFSHEFVSALASSLDKSGAGRFSLHSSILCLHQTRVNDSDMTVTGCVVHHTACI